jgi:predicted GIY-YIG superfamily endonuclease
VSALLVDARQLADMHVVYRMFDAGGCLLYVGMTGNLGARLKDHADKAWFLAVASITLERFPSYAEAAVAEQAAIGAEHPLYNHVGLSEEEASRRRRVRKVQFSEEKIRAAEEKRRLATEEKQRVAGEKQLAKEERARLIREQVPRDLLTDLNQILSQEHERVRVSALPHLLRQLAPWHIAYESLNGVKLRDELRQRGVRVINTGNTPRLDPADLRVAAEKTGYMSVLASTPT